MGEQDPDDRGNPHRFAPVTDRDDQDALDDASVTEREDEDESGKESDSGGSGGGPGASNLASRVCIAR